MKTIQTLLLMMFCIIIGLQVGMIITKSECIKNMNYLAESCKVSMDKISKTCLEGIE